MNEKNCDGAELWKGSGFAPNTWLRVQDSGKTMAGDSQNTVLQLKPDEMSLGSSIRNELSLIY